MRTAQTARVVTDLIAGTMTITIAIPEEALRLLREQEIARAASGDNRVKIYTADDFPDTHEIDGVSFARWCEQRGLPIRIGHRLASVKMTLKKLIDLSSGEIYAIRNLGLSAVKEIRNFQFRMKFEGPDMEIRRK